MYSFYYTPFFLEYSVERRQILIPLVGFHGFHGLSFSFFLFRLDVRKLFINLNERYIGMTPTHKPSENTAERKNDPKE